MNEECLVGYVASELRGWAASALPDQNDLKRKASCEADTDPDIEDDDNDDNTDTNNRKRVKRYRIHRDPFCDACGETTHDTRGCRLAIPELRDVNYRPDRQRLRFVEKVIAADPILQGKIIDIRKKLGYQAEA